MFCRVGLYGLCWSESRASGHDPRRRTGWWPRERMDPMDEYGHHAQHWPPPSVRFPRGVPMTEAELRIIAFLLGVTGRPLTRRLAMGSHRVAPDEGTTAPFRLGFDTR